MRRAAISSGLVDVGEVLAHDDELVAAEADHRVALARAARGSARPARCSTQVAGGVAEAVVDQLEVVDVEEQHADPSARCARRRASASSSRSASRRRLGSPVTGSWRAWWASACVGQLALGDVGEVDDDAPDGRVGALVGGGQLDPADATVVVDDPQLGPLGDAGRGLRLLE